MRNSGRLVVIGALLIAAIVLVTSGTMAFYSQSLSFSTLIHTARYTLSVNDSDAAEQTLSDMTLAPGQTRTRDIKIDTSKLDVPSTLTVTLTVHGSGALPGGLAVSLGGVFATPSGSGGLSASKVVHGAQDQIIHMPVSAAWTVAEGEDLEPYRSLEISYGVYVAAEQVEG